MLAFLVCKNTNKLRWEMRDLHTCDNESQASLSQFSLISRKKKISYKKKIIMLQL